MLRNPRIWCLAAGLALLLAVGTVTAASAAETVETEPAQAEGFSTTESHEESFADVTPSDKVDEDVELNPVDEASLLELSASRTADDPVFRKYVRLFPCSTCRRGIDHLAAGTGLRNTGYGTIRFRGIRPGSLAVSAFLYWAYIDTAPIAITQTVNFNGNLVTGFLVNTGPSPCWGGGTLRLYRAPVLPFLAPGINADYRVAGIPSAVTNGQDPWNPVNGTPPMAEGASLVVLFTHPSVPAGSWVQIHHPPQGVFFGTLNFTHFLNLPITTAATKHTRIGADGQVGGGLNNINVATNERTWLAGPIPQPFVQIRGNGSYGAGSEDSDWNGHDGEPLNQLWDTHTLNIPGTITPGFGTTNYRVRYTSPIDCVVPLVHVLTAR